MLSTRHFLIVCIGIAGFLAATSSAVGKEDKNDNKMSALERYLHDATQQQGAMANPGTPGSTWSPAVRFGEIASDLRANQVHDIVTVVVQERVSADSQGSVSTSRNSEANSSINALGGITNAVGPLRNLLGLGTSSALEGQGGTTRRTTLSATMAARVVDVLPNGNLVIEGTKNIVVNSENQMVRLRGVIRPYDVSALNTVLSGQIAEMDLTVNGKGVVGDAIRRPNFLYRLLRGLLPF